MESDNAGELSEAVAEVSGPADTTNVVMADVHEAVEEGSTLDQLRK